jgi:hypothetical protein
MAMPQAKRHRVALLHGARKKQPRVAAGLFACTGPNADVAIGKPAAGQLPPPPCTPSVTLLFTDFTPATPFAISPA